eukprot:scaffold635822_cov51-Prasinocladus_malaysianus.AAC.1
MELKKAKLHLSQVSRTAFLFSADLQPLRTPMRRLSLPFGLAWLLSGRYGPETSEELKIVPG